MELLEKSDNEIINTVTPLVETMESGWDADNYEQFTEHFSEQMKALITTKNYDRQRKHIFPILGQHSSLKLIKLHKNTDNVTLIWEMQCEKREIPILLMCSFASENNKTVISSAIINY